MYPYYLILIGVEESTLLVAAGTGG